MVLRWNMGSEWFQYFKGWEYSPRKGYLKDSNVILPERPDYGADDEHPIHPRYMLRRWVTSSVNIPERVDITGSKKTYLNYFFYTYTKNDNILRLFRLNIQPPSLENFVTDFSYFSPDFMTRIEARLNIIGERPFVVSGQFQNEIMPGAGRAELFGSVYKDNTWLYPGSKSGLYGRDYYPNVHSISPNLTANPGHSPTPPSLFPYNEDYNISNLKWWRSRYIEEHNSRLTALLFRINPFSFSFKRMSFKLIYHWSFNTLLLPFFLFSYNGDSFFKKLKGFMYSSWDFFLEFGYNPSIVDIDYNFFMYNLDIWIPFKSVVDKSNLDLLNVNFFEKMAFFQKFFLYTDEGFNVLFLNPLDINSKSFMNFTLNDFFFFNFPFIFFFLIVCFIAFPISHLFIFLFRQWNFESFQASYFALVDPNVIAHHSFDFYMNAFPNFIIPMTFFVYYTTYYYWVLNPFFQIDTTDRAIDRDLEKFYSYPFFDNFGLSEDAEEAINLDEWDPYDDDDELDERLEVREGDDDSYLEDSDDFFISTGDPSYTDPVDMGFLTVNDSEKDLIYRKFRKALLFPFYPKMWFKRMYYELIGQIGSPLGKIKLGDYRLYEDEFVLEELDYISDHLKYLNAVNLYASSGEAEDKFNAMEMVEKVYPFTLLGGYIKKLQDKSSSLDVYPGLKDSSREGLNINDIYPIKVHLKDEYFSFWFLDTVSHLSTNGLTSSRSFAVFTVELFSSFYVLSFFFFCYYFFLSDLLEIIISLSFSFFAFYFFIKLIIFLSNFVLSCFFFVIKFYKL